MSGRAWRDNCVELPVDALLKCSDAIMLNSEKCKLEENYRPLYKNSARSDNTFCKPTVPYIERLDSCKGGIADITAALRQCKYRNHEETILAELKTTADCIRRKYTNMNNIELPTIASPGPLRPTTLLDRAIEKHRLKKIQKLPAEEFGKVDIISLAGGGSQLKLQLVVNTSDRSSLKSKSSSSRRTDLPIFRYEHHGGKSRNLPGQPELIRLLYETEPGFKRDGASYDNNDSNNWLDLYGSVDPPLIDRIKRKARRRRKVVCKFCGKPPGCHNSWCIYYMTEPEIDNRNIQLRRSNTDIEIKSTKAEKPNSFLERSRTTVDQVELIRQDLPDYSTLHRDVYEHALATSRARRLLRGAYDFTDQITRPYVFSYFSVNKKSKLEGRSEMEHIFGKEDADFTKYYSQFVKERHTTM